MNSVDRFLKIRCLLVDNLILNREAADGMVHMEPMEERKVKKSKGRI